MTSTATAEVESASRETADQTTFAVDLVGIVPDLFAPSRPAETLHTVVSLARRTFGCDGAGVVLTARGGATAAVASGSDAVQADAMQVEYHQGPAFEAMAGRHPVVSPELRFDSRWRFWGPKAVDLGFRSVWSVNLGDGVPFGALTLYSRRPSFFQGGSPGPDLSFAQQVSVAITVAVEREQLVRARDSREIVGRATGILMERYGVTADEAIGMLMRYSSHSNQKLRLIAERVVSDRTFLELIVSG
jgi:hypothetical protein